MPTHIFTAGWRDQYGRRVSKEYTLADTAEQSLDLTIAAGAVTDPYAVAIVPAKTTGLYLVSSADVTVAINGGNEVQVLTAGGTIGAETSTVSYSGQTTTSFPIATTTGAQLQTLLEALSNIAPGDLVVTGAAGGPWTVTFDGTLSNTNVAALTTTPTGSATIGVVTTVAGVASDQTLTLLAGVPLVWFTGCGYSFPISFTVATIHVTNPGSAQATINLRTLYHP